MPITTADWLRYIESLGPTDSAMLQSRLVAAGVPDPRARLLASITRQRRWARAVSRIASFVGVALVGWVAWLWWLAFSGSNKAPGIAETAGVAIALATVAMALLISCLVELADRLDLLAYPIIPSELSAPPRRARVVNRSKIMRRMLLAVLLMTAAGLSAALPRIRNTVWLRDQGAETLGHITGLNTRRGSKGRVYYTMNYAFDRGEGSASIERKQYQRSKIGDAIPVTYLPSNPEISRAVTKSELQSYTAVVEPVVIIPVAYVIVAALVISFVVKHVNERALSFGQNGMAVLGHVTGVDRQAIRYRFPGPAGEIEGRYFFGKRQPRERPAMGQPLTILYLPDKPGRNMPLAALNNVELF